MTPETFPTIEALDTEYKARVAAVTSTIPTKECGRCNGKGVWGGCLGVCFKCGGNGVVWTSKGGKAARPSLNALELWYYRCQYIILRRDLRTAGSEWEARQLRYSLKSCEEAGKAAAARV